MIYNEEPIDALWDITRGLMFNADGTLKSDGIKIYREAMTEEAEDVPDSYIQLRSQITDTGRSIRKPRNVFLANT